MQVTSTSADLLQFQATPSLSESIIGGVDLTGSKAVADAIAKNAGMKKCQFMFVIPSFNPFRLQVAKLIDVIEVTKLIVFPGKAHGVKPPMIVSLITVPYHPWLYFSY